MEHRYEPRFPADHKLLVFRHGVPVATGIMSNFSRGGVFVKTDFNQIDINQSLDLELIARGSSRLPAYYGERRLCKTVVMHKTAEGVGLLVREDCIETQTYFTSFFIENIERRNSGDKNDNTGVKRNNDSASTTTHARASRF